MKFVKFLLLAALTAGLTWAADTHQPLGSSLPALGPLLEPFGGFWQNLRAESDAERSETLDLPGLTAPVTVVYDARRVPHIFAQTHLDALVAQGYVTARDRLWQMDVSTRDAAGRLSEVLGVGMLDRDRRQRRTGMTFAAENATAYWRKDPETWAMLEAYAAGVNAYTAALAPAEYPIEFKLLSYAPEPWTPYKTALFFKKMAQTLAGRHADLENTNTRAWLGESAFQTLFPEVNPLESPIIPKGTAFPFEPLPLDSARTQQPAGFYSTNLPWLEPDAGTFDRPAKPDVGIGSNNWAVGGERTKSGRPILCGDPHLGLTLPSIWYEVQLHTPEYNVYGVSLPGVPCVIIGFNENVAWSVTNVGHDVTDWYRVDWTDETRMTYRLDGAEEPVTLRIDTIAVRGRPPVYDTVRYTRMGPVVHTAAGHPYRDLAMRWLVHDTPTGSELMTFRNLNRAANYQDYSRALRSYDAPAQNFVFADRSGDIAIKANGKFPLKDPQEGRFVTAGNTSENFWQGWIPKDQVPQVKNPPRAFVSSANQRSADTDYPYYFNGGFADYRGRIINARLAGMDDITVEDMMALQTDNYSLFAQELLPLLLAQLDDTQLNTLQTGIVAQLRAWDYRFAPDAVAAPLFTEWAGAFYRLAWDEFYAQDEKAAVQLPEWWRTIELLRDEPQLVYWDVEATPQREGLRDIVNQAFREMHDALRDDLTAPDFNWSKARPLSVPHLARIEPFGAYGLPAGGHQYSINANKPGFGPSWRMIVHLTDPVEAYGVFPGGASGRPGDPYYATGLQPWVKGEYFKLFFMRDAEDRQQPVGAVQRLQ